MEGEEFLRERRDDGAGEEAGRESEAEGEGEGREDEKIGEDRKEGELAEIIESDGESEEGSGERCKYRTGEFGRGFVTVKEVSEGGAENHNAGVTCE